MIHVTDTLTRKDLIEMYRTMFTIRRFEESAVRYFKEGIVIGNMHMYIGEEAVATGVCWALQREDYIASTHRCDGHLIAKGADIRAMMAELMGKETGLCGGRAGKMHQSAPEIGVLCANGIVGASQTLATGHALYCSLYHPDRVAVSFFGDGGGNQGALLESMNLASVWKLPVVFVCENNHYAISTNVKDSTALGHFYQRAEGFGIPGTLVDGLDPVAVYEAARTAVDRARAGAGPSFIECDTCRMRGHHEGDEQSYRTREEMEENRTLHDCIKLMRVSLEKNCAWTEEEDRVLREEVEQNIADAIQFGIDSKPMSAETMYQHLFASEG